MIIYKKLLFIINRLFIMIQLALCSKQQIRNYELNRLLNELKILNNKSYKEHKSKIRFTTIGEKIKNYCRIIIKKGDPCMSQRLYYALYKSKKGKNKNIAIQANRKLNLLVL